jgi:glucose/arabinose dehydrogenase
VKILVVDANAATLAWHNVGSIGFDASGAMWVLAGDKTRSEFARNKASPLGKVLRIVPDKTSEGGYTAPADNPASDDASWAPEVFAMGLRNSFRGVVDSRGRYFVADVGSAVAEEVNVITKPGQDFGWPKVEGGCNFDCDGLTQPLTYWGRSSTHRYVREDPLAATTVNRCAYVGVFYESSELDPYSGRLDNHLIYGDYNVGFVRALVINDKTEVTDDIPIGHLGLATTWRKGPDGYLYASPRLAEVEDGSPILRAVLENP